MSCTERGQIISPPIEFIEIHGKVYKLTKIVPAANERAIWIMYPKDSSDNISTILNYQEQNGKYTKDQTIIKID